MHGRKKENGGLASSMPFPRIALLALLALVAAGCMFGAGSTYSWFVYSGLEEIPLTAGDVSYFPKDNTDGSYGSFISNTVESEDDSYIYPGRELIEVKDGALNVLRLENRSTVTTNVRIRITAQVVTKYGLPEAATHSAVCWPSQDVYQLGITEEKAGRTLMVPLLNLAFETGKGYEWNLVDAPLMERSCEWELVPAGQTVSTAAVAVPAGAGDRYNTLVSVKVVPELPTAEEEQIFTELYSGSRLLITVEYLAKQREAMDWQVFYQNRFSL